MKYNERIKEFKGKKPTKDIFSKHALVPISISENPYTYEYRGISIASYFESKDKFFDLSTDEILSILEYYGLSYPELATININHYNQPCIQGMANMEDAESVCGKGLTLFIPVDKIKFRFGDIKNTFEASVCLLLHEISHLLGNTRVENGSKCEPEADRFAIQEYKKWLEVL